MHALVTPEMRQQNALDASVAAAHNSIGRIRYTHYEQARHGWNTRTHQGHAERWHGWQYRPYLSIKELNPMKFSMQGAVAYLRSAHKINLSSATLRNHIPPQVSGNKLYIAPALHAAKDPISGYWIVTKAALDAFAARFKSAQQTQTRLGVTKPGKRK